MLRTSCSILVLLLLTVPARSQQPLGGVLERLRSEDLAQVACAAREVAEGRLKAAVPAVRARLAGMVGCDEEPELLTRLCLLDALVRCRVVLPGEELLPHAVRYLRTPCLILAAMAPRVNTYYFEQRFFGAEQFDAEWRICGNMLAAQAVPRFTARCLADYCRRLVIRVRDGGKYQPSSGW